MAGPAQAADTAPCQERTVTLSAQADAWIDEDGPLSNKGSDSILMVRSAADGKNARALLRFAVPAAPAGCVVEFARLRIFASSGDPSSRLEAVRLAFGWSENLVTWSSQPQTVGAAAVAWGGDGYVQWNVRSQVEDMLGSANHGFVIRDAAESAEAGGDQSFHSREKGDEPPQLVVRFAAPETEAPGPPAEPVPAAVSCGQEITRSVLLTNNLSNCPGDALVIADDRIIVDLGGRTIDGVGLGTGIRNDGFDTVTVRNGTVQEFDYGIQLLPETDLNLIERLSLSDNQIGGIELSDAGEVGAGNEIRANVLEHNGDGIALIKGSSGALVIGNTMSLNSGPGLWVAQSDGNRLEGNSVSGSGDLGVGLEHASGNTLAGNDVSGNSDGGIEVRAGSHGNRIEGNTVSASGDTGILISESDRNEVVGNHAELLSDSGITLDVANDGVVRGNVVPSNPGGIELNGSSRNLVELNDAGDTDGIGIYIGTDSLENDIVANTAGGNAAQGIYVSDETSAAQGNLLDRNIANANGSDGIVTAKGGHTLTFNVANDNRGWGMHAAPGTIDGRGNVALRNTSSGQCSGIVCNADVTPPETSLGGAPVDPTSSAAATFSFSGTDDRTSAAALRFQCRLDTAEFAACTSPRAYSGLAEGEHAFEVRALDQAGNVDPSPAVHRWTVDRTAPDTTIRSAPAEHSASTAATFSFEGSDDRTEQVEFECRLDAEEEFDDCDSPATYTDLLEGGHRIEVRAVDEAGNVDLSPASHSWTVDVTSPETSIASGPADQTNERSARLEFASGEPGSTFECRLNEAGFGPCENPAELSALGEGTHRFEVRAIDRAGNVDGSPASHVWTVDTTAPETSIEGGPPDPSGSGPASISFAGEDDRAAAAALRFECRTDGETTFSACTSPATYAAPAEGAHTFEVRAIDPAGNVDPSPARHSWTVDMTPPETSIVESPPDPSGESSARFEFAGEDDRTDAPALRFECRLDDAAYASCETGEFYSDLGDGEHRFEVRAIDRAGNADASPAAYEWTVDTVAPETAIDSAPPEYSGETSARFEFSANQGGSRFECRLDGAAFSPCESPRSYAGLGDGDHRFEVRAIDPAGNVDGSPAGHLWIVDTVAPETSIVARPAEYSGEASARFEFEADERGVAFECRLDGAAFSPCESPHLLSSLGDGEHRFEVRAIDPAGNADGSPASYVWTVDTTAPATQIVAGPPDPSDEASATFEFEADEPGSSFECRLDDAAFTPCESPRSYSDLADGEHRFQVRATDRAGNVGSPAVHEWTVDTTEEPPADTTPPETTLGSRPATPTTSQSAGFTFTGSDDVTAPAALRFECRLDDSAFGFTPCSSPQLYSGLADGRHTFEVRAVDAAGNADNSPATHTWTIDRTAPETTIGNAPATATASTSASFTFTGSEPGSTFECSLDNAAFTACTSPRSYSNLSANTSHQFRVRARDALGNVDGTPAVHTWTIDTTAPQTTINTGPPTTTGPDATLTFSSNESTATFECSLDNAAYAACTSPKQYAGLAGGSHQVRIRARDAAGNVDGSPATRSWTVDATPPQTTLGATPPATTSSTSASFGFTASESGSTFQCRLDAGAFEPCTSPRAYQGLSEGPHTFAVRATDARGNQDQSPATFSWTITPPPTGCVAPAVTTGSVADSWVLQSSTNTNYGTDSTLKVDSKNGGNARALVRLTLPGVPAGCVVTDAKLRLYAASYKTGRTLQALRIAASWTETTVRWSNQPATTGTAATAPSGSGYREWTVTQQVRDMYSSGNNGFLIRDATENGGGVEQGFNSREKGSDNPPRLVVTFGNP
jgi:parallel beta-helix repeat protein